MFRFCVFVEMGMVAVAVVVVVMVMDKTNIKEKGNIKRTKKMRMDHTDQHKGFENKWLSINGSQKKKINKDDKKNVKDILKKINKINLQT